MLVSKTVKLILGMKRWVQHLLVVSLEQQATRLLLLLTNGVNGGNRYKCYYRIRTLYFVQASLERPTRNENHIGGIRTQIIEINNKYRLY